MEEVSLICTVVEYRETPPTGVPIGKYLELAINDNPIVRVDYNEYLNQYESNKELRDPLLPVEYSALSGVEETGALDSKKESGRLGRNIILSYLTSKIDTNLLSGATKVKIVSDVSSVLELPWEEINDNNSIVLRKYKTDSPTKCDLSSINSMIILMSHAHEGVGGDLKKIMDDEINSIYESIRILHENNQPTFRIDNILLSKHTTKTSIKNVDWKSYNYIHLIAHGDANGNIALERPEPENYKIPDTFSKNEFMELVESHNFKLVFLSYCYSGGGNTNNEDSLAFQLVKNGISEYCIGYRDPVLESAAKNFSSIFYEYLLLGQDIIETYRQSLNRFYSIRSSRKDIPYLYIS